MQQPQNLVGWIQTVALLGCTNLDATAAAVEKNPKH